ncbi:MAG: hypothetical protein ACYC6Z_00880 [Thermoleophilia bacterium]
MTSDFDSSAIAGLVRLGQKQTGTALSAAFFDVHGVRTRAESNSGEVTGALTRFLRAFPGNESAAADIQVYLFTVDSLDEAMPAVPETAPLLYDWGKVKIHHEGPLRYQQVDTRAIVVADVEHRVAVGFAEKGLLQTDWLITNLFFYPLWGQLLKECGLFPLHAAGLVRDGRSCLFLGRSGSGKSTLTLHLVRNGYGLLSDDTVFLRESGGTVEALSFPEEINVSEQTIELIPELSRVENFTVNELRQKSSFSIEELYPGCVVDGSVPALMVFPEITEVEATALEPMTSTAALALALRFGFFFLDPSTTGRHFEILSLLARQTSGYRLYSGSDQEQLEQVVDELLTSSLEQDQTSGERKE